MTALSRRPDGATAMPNEDKPGELWVAELEDDEDRDRSLASYVYRSTLLNQTRNLLQEYMTFSEDQIALAVVEYYHRLSNSVIPDELWTDVVKGHWGTVTPYTRSKYLRIPC